MMSSEDRNDDRFYQKHAWIILFGLASLLSLSTMGILVSGSNPPMQFEVDTGISWTSFAGDYPTVATLVTLTEQLIGTGFLGFALFATVIAFTKYRAGERWAWYIMWIFAGVLTLAAVLFFTHEQAYVGYFYIGAAVLVVVGLLLPVRKFFPD